MAGKGSMGRGFDHVVSKTPKERPVRVVHISNPTEVKASVSEFRSVVQSLTGQKRSLTSSQAAEALGADSDHSPPLKAAKWEYAAALKGSWSRINSAASDTRNICHNNNISITELGYRDDPLKHKISPIEIQQQMFQSLDRI